MDVAVLKQALEVTNPVFTPEMKDYIRSVITVKEGPTATTAEPVQPEVVS